MERNPTINGNLHFEGPESIKVQKSNSCLFFPYFSLTGFQKLVFCKE